MGKRPSRYVQSFRCGRGQTSCSDLENTPHLLCDYFKRAKEDALLAPDRLFKVVLVGNSSVGKTSLLRSFCEGRFHPSTTATVGENRRVGTVGSL